MKEFDKVRQTAYSELKGLESLIENLAVSVRHLNRRFAQYSPQIESMKAEERFMLETFAKGSFDFKLNDTILDYISGINNLNPNIESLFSIQDGEFTLKTQRMN